MEYNLKHVSSIGGIEKRQEFLACMNDLNTELKGILDSELKTGNQVLEASRDWPDPGSVFITLSQPFHEKYDTAETIKYSEPNDPHYWKADYSCGKPVHVLAC
jgi:hypothetical protein